MDRRLGKDDWLRVARLALLRGGVEDIRLDRLARDLHVTKGSFYWHFRDRGDLLEALLSEWEDELREIVAQLRQHKHRHSLIVLVRVLAERARVSEAGGSPSDAAIFSWAAASPEVRRRVNRVEEQRVKLLKKMIPDGARAELFYLIWLGFVSRGQRLPESRLRFLDVARMALRVLLPAKPRGRARRQTRRAARA